MDHYRYVVIGAGISGLAFGNRIKSNELVILERDCEIGGYSRTIKQDGFVWDYSGHFFHFNNAEIEREIFAKMDEREIIEVEKVSQIYWPGGMIDFPFQKNIHQLPKADLIDCLHGLHFRPSGEPENFKEMLYARFGQGIAERFLVPYNEKLYATDLDQLDKDAMGRFFPYAEQDDIYRNFKRANNSSYNTFFKYPLGGAIEYVKAIASGIDPDKIAMSEQVRRIDTETKILETDVRIISYDVLVNTAPLPKFLGFCGLNTQTPFTANKVLVFNMGFDRKGPEAIHWIYYPQKEISFYRVGFYDNILGSDRMSIYVEIGLPYDAIIGEVEISAYRELVIADLQKVGVVSDQQLVSHHYVVMNPAYVHLTKQNQLECRQILSKLEARNVHSLGRYGGWKYCSIEDNIIEARNLADRFTW